MMRALLRGDRHIASRLAGTVSLTLAASLGYASYQGRFSALAAGAMAAFSLTMLVVGVARGRFHAPPR